MHVSDAVHIVCNGITDTSLIQLHMVYIIQHIQSGRIDQTADFRTHLGIFQEISNVICGDVQRLKIHVNSLFFSHLRTFQQHIIHGTKFYRVRQIIIMVDNHTAVSQCVGVDGHAFCSDFLCRFHRRCQRFQIFFLMSGIHQ